MSMSLNIEFQNTIEEPWLSIDPVIVGETSRSYSTPDVYLTLGDEDNPIMRVDIYSGSFACFKEAIIWNEFLCVGYGEDAYLINRSTLDVKAIECNGYFGHLYHSPSRLLVASAENLICIDSNAEILWKSEMIGIDGVVVNQFDESEIIGEGEFDPPGGWREFRIDTLTGRVAK